MNKEIILLTFIMVERNLRQREKLKFSDNDAKKKRTKFPSFATRD